jgi:Fur family ferric uptake transcriptional regulator
MSARTRQRDTIRQVFVDNPRPLSPAELHDLAAEHLPELGKATVYRTIRMLLEEEFLKVVSLPGDADRYEMVDAPAGHHHHHFRCNQCDRVFDLSGCVPHLRDLLPKGFTMSEHEIFLFGQCAECNA